MSKVLPHQNPNKEQLAFFTPTPPKGLEDLQQLPMLARVFSLSIQ